MVVCGEENNVLLVKFVNYESSRVAYVENQDVFGREEDPRASTPGGAPDFGVEQLMVDILLVHKFTVKRRELLIQYLNSGFKI